MLIGNASVLAPFGIESGGSYNLTNGHTQDVTVSFCPTLAQLYSEDVTFTGGGGATRPVTGTGELVDSDGDGIYDYQEIQWGLDPDNSDTDDDGLTDGYEVSYDGDSNTYNPYNPDTSEGFDLNATSDDTDEDGMPDGWELQYADILNPLNETDAGADSDGDGYSNLEEFQRCSIPNDPNSFFTITIYVDDDADGTNYGSSWADAYNNLRDALSVAIYGDEIWVAEGIYKPDLGTGITSGDREATFQLVHGVALYGGYAGIGAQDPNERDIFTYKSILSVCLGE